MRVLRAPSAFAIGPVTANETGTPEVEMNQSGVVRDTEHLPGDGHQVDAVAQEGDGEPRPQQPEVAVGERPEDPDAGGLRHPASVDA